mgnify:CR=1 FL=1
MTWAYADKPEMTKQLADATIAVANENNAMVIPVGLAFANALKQRPELKMTVADNRHPTAAGTYLEAATILAALTKKSPEGSSYLGGCEKPLKEKDAAFLQKVAWDTVRLSMAGNNTASVFHKISVVMRLSLIGTGNFL